MVMAFTSTVSGIISLSDTHDEPVFEVLDKQGNIDQKSALKSAMKIQCDNILSNNIDVFNDKVVDQDQKLIDHIVENTTRDLDGRLVM